MEQSGLGYNRMSKVVIVGDSGVGKSALMIRFTTERFAQSYQATIGADFAVKTMNVGEQIVKLQVWDTAGQERFRTISQAFYRGANGVILTYDCANEESFKNIQQWIDEVDKHASTHVTKVLVGNKSDRSDKVISTERGEALAKELGVAFFEISVKDNIHIDKPFYHLAEEACRQVSLIPNSEGSSINQSTPPPKKKGCC